MAVPNSEAVQWLPRGSTSAESRSGRIGPITLGAKQTGERSAGNPHAAFDEAGAGNVARPRSCDTRRRKSEPTGNTNFGLNRRASPRPYRREGRRKPSLPLSNMLEIVACGQPLPGHEIRIVDEAGHELGERREGRLEFRGPSTTHGYFHNEAKTKELIRAGWLDSGDRAYMAGGDVYVTGRVKDIIIRAGRHLYPQEIEEEVAGIPGIRKGGVAVFGVADQAAGTERVVVLAETRETDPARRAALQSRAHEVVTDAAGAPPDEIVLAPPGSVPKTSSGKIRRSAAKDLYETGRVGPARRPVWRQLLRLAVSGIGPQVRRVARLACDVIYAGWWWVVLSAAFVVGSLAVLILPRVEWRWYTLRR